MHTVEVWLSRLDPTVPIPTYAHSTDAAVDLTITHDVVIEPGERAYVGTGIAIALPSGYAGFVQPRSGMAASAGLSIVNSPGLIDSGYRGEIKVCLVNLDPRKSIVLAKGDRVAQLVIQKVERVVFRETQALPESDRGSRGHGSTGIGVIVNMTTDEGVTDVRSAT